MRGKKKYKEALSRLNDYISDALRKEENSYSQEYRNSKWYEKPTLSEAFGDTVSRDIRQLIDALSNGDDLSVFAYKMEESAREFGRRWWDEDLNCSRSGCEWETETYVYLHNLLAEVIGKKLITFDECWEGYGDY